MTGFGGPGISARVMTALEALRFPNDYRAGDPLTPPLRTGETEPQVPGIVTRFDAGQSNRQVRARDFAIQCVLGLRGHASYLIGGQLHDVGPNTLLCWSPAPEDPYRDGAPYRASEDYSAWCAFFGRSVVTRAAHHGGAGFAFDEAHGGGQAHRLNRTEARRIEAQFEQLVATESGTERFGAALEYLLLSTWGDRQGLVRVGSADLHPAVEKAAYILKTQPETGSMQELARTCGASASWLSRLFRQQVGISLVSFRNRSRIERFFELYGHGHRRNLTQAAFAAGFGSYAQFHRVFKETLGYSPADLKRNPQDHPPFSGERFQSGFVRTNDVG